MITFSQFLLEGDGASIEVKQLKTLESFSSLFTFDVPEVRRKFSKWQVQNKNEFADQEGGDREKALQKGMTKFNFKAWIRAAYGNVENFVEDCKLKPKYGWLDSDEKAVFMTDQS